MKELRFAIFGAGFWTRFQLAAWRELKGARCVAIYNRTRAKAKQLAAESGIPAVYDDPAKLLREVKPDFVDNITEIGGHKPLSLLCARHRVACICQKPLAASLADARAMAAAFRKAKTLFLVHENWRWQTPLRELKCALDAGVIGRVFRARIDYCNSFPVFDNQPFLKTLEQFILTDIGTHVLDAARFLFGEATRLCCQTTRVHPNIKGEDVATVLLQMRSGATVTCNMSYASRGEHDRFPETFVLVEGSEGSIELAPDFWLRVTTKAGTTARRCPPPFYPWADPRYAVVHSSMVACNRNLLAALQRNGRAETTAEDNLRTLQLVFGAYDSARRKAVVTIHHEQRTKNNDQ